MREDTSAGVTVTSIEQKKIPKKSGTSLGKVSLKWTKLGLVISDSVSTGVWCVPGFGAGFEIALKPSEMQKERENPGKGHLYFLRQQRDLKIDEIGPKKLG